MGGLAVATLWAVRQGLRGSARRRSPARVLLEQRSKPQCQGKRGHQGRPEIVELELGASVLGMERRMEIHLLNGRRLSITEHVDLDVIERVVAVLER